MTIIDPRYKQYQYNTIQTLTTNATNGNGGANGANNTIQTQDEFLDNINQRLGSGDKTAIEELQKKGVPAIVTEEDDGSYKVQYTYGRTKYTVTYFPPSDSNKNGENVNNNGNNNSVPPQTTTPPAPSTPPLSNTQPAGDGAEDKNVNNTDANETPVVPPNVGTTGAEGVTGSEEVEGVDKVEGVDDVDGTNGATSSKWAGLVDENDPVMLLQLLGYDDLGVYCSTTTGEWFVGYEKYPIKHGDGTITWIEFPCYEVIDEETGEVLTNGKDLPDTGTGIYGREYSDELQNLPNVFFDLKTGKFLPEKVKNFLATQNEFECRCDYGPLTGNLEEIAPGLFKMTATRKAVTGKEMRKGGTVEETKMYIYDPTYKQLIELPKERDNELGTITQAEYLDLVSDSEYMKNAMDKYIQNGYIKIDQKTLFDGGVQYSGEKNTEYSVEYLAAIQTAYEQARKFCSDPQFCELTYCYTVDTFYPGSSGFGMNATHTEWHQFSRPSLFACEELAPGIWGTKGKNGEPDTVEFYFTGGNIVRANDTTAEPYTCNVKWHGTKIYPAPTIEQLTKQSVQKLGDTIYNLGKQMRYDDFREKQGYSREWDENDIKRTNISIEAFENLYFYLTGNEKVNIVKLTDNEAHLLEKEGRYSRVTSLDSKQNTQIYAFYGNETEEKELLDILSNSQKLEDSIPWYALEKHYLDDGVLEPTFAEDTTEFHRNLLLKAGYLEKNIVESELMTGTEIIKFNLIEDFGFSEDCFFIEDDKIYMTSKELQRCNTIKYEKLGSTTPINWRSLLASLGGVYKNGDVILDLSTYYKKMYNSTEALHKIYLTNVAAQDKGSATNFNAEKELNELGTAIGTFYGDKHFESIFKIFFEDNKEIFDLLKKSDATLEIANKMYGANSISELLDYVELLNSKEKAIGRKLDTAIRKFYYKACEQFGIDPYIVTYQELSKKWCLGLKIILFSNDGSYRYDAENVGLRELLEIAKQQPERIREFEKEDYNSIINEIEKFDAMSWEEFKAYCIEDSEDAGDDRLHIDKNIIINYLRELGAFTSWEPYNPDDLNPIA